MSCQGYHHDQKHVQRLSNTVLNGLKRTLYKVRRAYIAARVRDSCGEFGNVDLKQQNTNMGTSRHKPLICEKFVKNKNYEA